MGVQAVTEFSDSHQKRAFTKRLLNEIRALDYMLEHNMIERNTSRIGAEQELVLLDMDLKPALNNMELLDLIKDDHYTTEIARFNLEINLDPFDFNKDCFAKMEKQLVTLLEKGEKAAAILDTNILLTGIAPTVGQEHLHFEHMTPNARYRSLNDMIRAERKTDFELNMSGRDELVTQHPNILFEACNTSFQVHLQIDPDEFVEQYNWSQLIAGPVLAIAANSPLLMGKRLWSETRIALFQQSVNTRNTINNVRNKEPRVSFGKQWVKDSVTDLYKDNVSRFSALFHAENEEDAYEMVKAGKVPSLSALNLHNGTVYKWNRPCYGVGGGKPHLRIENRYIPSGPTVIDEMATSAFWLGLMVGLPEKYKNLPELMDFDDVRFNFYNAARSGMESHLNWFGKIVPARRLLEKELLDLAYAGLDKMKVNSADITRYMSVIENRLSKKITGARWMSNNYSELLKGSTPNEACLNLTKKMLENQRTGKPVHTWKNLDLKEQNNQKQFKTVNEIMETDLFTVTEDDAIDLVVNVMNWQNIRHVPVENSDNELVGIINAHSIIHFLASKKESDEHAVKDIMLTNFPTISATATAKQAVTLMADNRVDALPVVDNANRLLGIVTESDIIQVLKMTNKISE
ncbi:MAG: CBS domain-containing protein/gamma-glutamylcysteine synthetase [bacterium]|jgi:CBS domain-containing protein/gamma-glutamylcysteine synthetase